MPDIGTQFDFSWSYRPGLVLVANFFTLSAALEGAGSEGTGGFAARVRPVCRVYEEAGPLVDGGDDRWPSDVELASFAMQVLKVGADLGNVEEPRPSTPRLTEPAHPPAFSA